VPEISCAANKLVLFDARASETVGYWQCPVTVKLGPGMTEMGLLLLNKESVADLRQMTSDGPKSRVVQAGHPL
jgi:hypothetical protein